jgi:signal peptidase I
MSTAPIVKTNEYFYSEVKRGSGSKRVVNLLQIVAILLVIVVILYLVILLPNQVDGFSMEPNFHNQELMFTDKVINWLGPLIPALNYTYQRGDVVVFPADGHSLIKRIIGMPGDVVRIENNRVFVNNKLLNEKYLSSEVQTNMPFSNVATMAEGESFKVPDDSFFLMGDNRPNSKDSRFADIGPIKKASLQGRVFFRYWPLARLGIIGRGETELQDIVQ